MSAVGAGWKQAIRARAPVALSLMPNQRRSLDFVSDQLMDGRRYRMLTVVDDCTRECLALIASTSLSGARVARELSVLFEVCGTPMAVVNDNGAELLSNAIPTFADDRKIGWHCFAPGTPTQNAFIESFKGHRCDELLNETFFPSLHPARMTQAVWCKGCNTERPYARLGWQTPAKFAQTFTT